MTAVPDRPAIRRVLETVLYVDDMARAVAFYRDVPGLRIMGGHSVELATPGVWETY